MVEGNEVPLRAASFEVLATMTVPDSPSHPLRHMASSIEGFDYYWKLLQFVFEIGSIHSVKPLNCALVPSDLRVLKRYVTACKKIASSEILNREQSYTFSFGQTQSVTVEADRSTEEVTRGFSALFRQIANENDEASFSKALSIVNRVNEQVADGDRDDRRVQLAEWRKRQGQLKGNHLRHLVWDKLVAQGKMSATLDFPDGRSVSAKPDSDAPQPKELIRVFQYGELIHWGDAESELAAYFESPETEALRTGQFLHAAAGLAHFYMAFASFLVALIPQLDD